MGKALALLAELDAIPSTTYGPRASPGMIPQDRALKTSECDSKSQSIK